MTHTENGDVRGELTPTLGSLSLSHSHTPQKSHKKASAAKVSLPFVLPKNRLTYI